MVAKRNFHLAVRSPPDCLHSECSSLSRRSAKVRDFPLLLKRLGMITEPNNNPLHGVTLEQILTALVAHYEWKGWPSALIFAASKAIRASSRA